MVNIRRKEEGVSASNFGRSENQATDARSAIFFIMLNELLFKTVIDFEFVSLKNLTISFW